MQLIDFYIDGGEWLIVGKFVDDLLSANIKPWVGAAVEGQSTETFPCDWNKTDKKGFIEA